MEDWRAKAIKKKVKTIWELMEWKMFNEKLEQLQTQKIRYFLKPPS